MRRIRPGPLLALTFFVIGMTVYIYGYEHRADADYAREEGLDEALVLASAALLHVALGAGLRWKAIPVLLLPIVIALPAGAYPGGWPEGSVAQTMFVQELVFGLPLVGLGMVIGWAYERFVSRGTA